VCSEGKKTDYMQVVWGTVVGPGLVEECREKWESKKRREVSSLGAGKEQP
jgi:hypothetical protein